MTNFKDNFMSKYGSGVIVPLLVLGMGLMAYFLMLPKYKAIQLARDTARAKQAEFDTREETLKQVQALLVEYNQKKDKLKPIDESVPTAPRIPELLGNLDEITRQSGMRITALQIIPAPTLASVAAGQAVSEVKKTEELLGVTENLAILQVNIELTGSYPTLKAWLQNAEANLRLLDARVVVADNIDEENGTQGFTLKIQTYYQRDEK